MNQNRLLSTTATAKEISWIKHFMDIYASTLGEGQTIQSVYSGGSVVVTRQDGAFHAAINVRV